MATYTKPQVSLVDNWRFETITVEAISELQDIMYVLSQVRGFSRHHRAPSIRAASYAIVKPSTLFQKMENLKRFRGHRNVVYCANLTDYGDMLSRDDRLVKIWSMETALCLASCRGHEV
ncbi:hypothetical protein M8C21_019837, partial [Ambrosia artemisiifolia]